VVEVLHYRAEGRRIDSRCSSGERVPGTGIHWIEGVLGHQSVSRQIAKGIVLNLSMNGKCIRACLDTLQRE
jgi:hypothetical protein